MGDANAKAATQSVRPALASFRDAVEDRIQDWKAQSPPQTQTIERVTASSTLPPGSAPSFRARSKTHKASPRTAPPEKPRLMAGFARALLVALIALTKYCSWGQRAEELLEEARTPAARPTTRRTRKTGTHCAHLPTRSPTLTLRTLRPSAIWKRRAKQQKCCRMRPCWT